MSAFLLIFRNSVPCEYQAPVKATNLRLSWVAQILERVPVNHIYYRTDDSVGFLLYSAQQRDRDMNVSWMDGWMDGRTDGWLVSWLDRWTE